MRSLLLGKYRHERSKLNFCVRMGTGVTKLLWPSQKFVLNKVYKTYVSHYFRFADPLINNNEESFANLLSGGARVVKWDALKTHWLSAFEGSNPSSRIYPLSKSIE